MTHFLIYFSLVLSTALNELFPTPFYERGNWGFRLVNDPYNVTVLVKDRRVRTMYIGLSFELLDPIPMNMYVLWVRLPYIPLRNSQTPSGCPRIQLNSTQFWHYLTGDSITFHRLRVQSCKTASSPPVQMQVTSLDCYL